VGCGGPGATYACAVPAGRGRWGVTRWGPPGGGWSPAFTEKGGAAVAHRTTDAVADPGTSGRPDSPAAPARLGAAGWAAAARRSAGEFKEDSLQDCAAALTYYGILSIFPGLLVLVSLLGLLGKSATQPVITGLTKAAPGSVRQVVLNAMTHLQHSHAAAGILAAVGIAVGLWSASGYVAGFMRASNVIYDVPEGRPLWKITPIRLAVTL